MIRPEEPADGPAAPPPGMRVAAAAVAFESGLLAAGIVIAWLLGKPTFLTIGPSAAGTALGILGTAPLLLLLLALQRSTLPPLVRLRTEVDRHLLPLFRGCKLPQIAAIAAAAGVGEEVLFRGVVQGFLTEAVGPVTGLLGAAVLFGLAHMVTRTYAVLAGLVGIYLGWLAMVGGGLWIPMVAHAAYDFVALSVWVRGAPAAGPPAGTNPTISEKLADHHDDG